MNCNESLCTAGLGAKNFIRTVLIKSNIFYTNHSEENWRRVPGFKKKISAKFKSLFFLLLLLLRNASRYVSTVPVSILINQVSINPAAGTGTYLRQEPDTVPI